MTKRVASGRKYQMIRVFAIHAQISRKTRIALVMDVRLTVIPSKMSRGVKRAMTYQKEALALIMVVYGKGEKGWIDRWMDGWTDGRMDG